MSAPSMTWDSAAGSLSVVDSTATSNRALMNWRALSPCSGLREVMITLTPLRARRPAERWPTGPVPARITAFLPRRSPERLLDLRDRCDGGGVGAVRVEHHRHGQRLEHGVHRHGEQLFAGRHVAAADPHRGVLQVLRAAREDAAMDEVADVGLDHVAVAHDRVGAGIVCHHLVEDAGEPGAVELEEELLHEVVSRGSSVVSGQATGGRPETLGRPPAQRSAKREAQPSAPPANG